MGRDYSWVQPREIGSLAAARGVVASLLLCLGIMACGYCALGLAACDPTLPLLLRAAAALTVALWAIPSALGPCLYLAFYCLSAARCSLGPRGVSLTFALGRRRHVAWDDVVAVDASELRLRTTQGPVSLAPPMVDCIAGVLRRRELPEQAPTARALNPDRLGLEPDETLVWRQPGGAMWATYVLPLAFVAAGPGLWHLALRIPPAVSAALVDIYALVGLVISAAVGLRIYEPERSAAVTMTCAGIERRSGRDRVTWDWSEWLVAERERPTIAPHQWRARTADELLVLDDSDPVQARILHAIQAAIACGHGSPPSRGGWVAPSALSRVAAPTGTVSSAAISRAT